MTRINLISPEKLSNQHLMAEYREIYHIPKALERSLRSRSKQQLDSLIPKSYTLNKGHVMHFYNKGKFLEDRSYSLYSELIKRDYRVVKKNYPTEVFKQQGYYNDYNPTLEEVEVNEQRIRERLALRPGWYKYYKLSLF